MRDQAIIRIDCTDRSVSVDSSRFNHDRIGQQMEDSKAFLIAQVLMFEARRLMQSSNTDLKASIMEVFKKDSE